MRLSAAFIATSLASFTTSTLAASPSAHVYFYDPNTSFSIPELETISPENARLIFAQRLGLDRFFTIKDADERLIKQLNQYGGPADDFAYADVRDDKRRVLVVVEGTEDPKDLIQDDPALHSFLIDDPPCDEANWHLLSELSAQAEQLFASKGGEGLDPEVTRILAKAGDLQVDNTVNSHHWRTFAHIKSLPEISKRQGSSSSEFQRDHRIIRQQLNDLIALAGSKGISLTIALMPPATHRSSKRSYGIGARTPNAQRQGPEEPLSIPAPPQASTSPNASPDSSNILQANKTLPRGPIPTCFSSLNACQSGTLNCTGHGECIKRYKSEDSSCWGCTCTKPEVRKNKDGTKKTTYFGGGACHKKDVSVPFWLIGGFTVFLVSVVSWGIGLLYSMGSQELPSVIGAGVSGPRAK